jgi:hypothetical protein
LLAIGKRTEALNIPISNHIAVSYQQPLIILLGSLIVLARARLPWHWKNKTIQGAMPSTPSGHGDQSFAPGSVGAGRGAWAGALFRHARSSKKKIEAGAGRMWSKSSQPPYRYSLHVLSGGRGFV